MRGNFGKCVEIDTKMRLCIIPSKGAFCYKSVIFYVNTTGGLKLEEEQKVS
jgi:hypothetical protein